MTSAFDQLARPIQHALWDLGWEALRPIQCDTIHAFVDGDDDLLISAATASGKTEAAFLPVLSAMSQRDEPGVQAIYVGPLKALINDQFGRLETLCERAELPVHRWHGDVSASAKAKLIRRPAGVLLITPESLESLMLNRTGHLPAVFAALRWVVIDEVHAFVGQSRGSHLRSLLYRLDALLPHTFRMIGLSATVGDPDATRRWFGSDRGPRTRLIEERQGKPAIRLQLDAVPEAAAAAPGSAAENDETEPHASGVGLVGVAERLSDLLPNRSNLVFCNAKRHVEALCDHLTRIAQRQASLQQYRVHHGSLSKTIREDAETAMKSGRPTTTVCSSTLELGIDIGDVARVGQLGAPSSVSSVIQRIGRSGRREGEAATMLMYCMVDAVRADSPPEHRLSIDLIQGIAVLDLMLEGWCEPPRLNDLDLSTLTHQVLACLTQTGGITASDLYQQLVTQGAFAIDTESFAELLRALGDADLIEQHPDGGLILGLRGEQVARHYSFYAVFPSPVEFRVVHGTQHIGMIDAELPPLPKEHLLLAGRRWQVTSVDAAGLRIDVQPASGSKPPRFGGRSGDVHRKIHERMREVLTGQAVPRYITQDAVDRLATARAFAESIPMSVQGVAPLGARESLVLAYAGSRVVRTLCEVLRWAGITASDRGWCVGLRAEAEPTDVSEALRRWHKNQSQAQRQPQEDTADDRLGEGLPLEGKFDEYLSDPLRKRVARSRVLDIPGASRWCEQYVINGQN
ncbi:MAG: DEAD/DEAH box helicase [Planctomycetota bacterium]